MAYLDYLFDTEYRQRRDINQLKTEASGLAGDVSSIDAQLRDVGWKLEQLSATVRVLMRRLAAAGQLDLATIKAEVSAEIHQPHALDGAKLTATCVRCGKTAPADEMVKLGADTWCRPCARNP